MHLFQDYTFSREVWKEVSILVDGKWDFLFRRNLVAESLLEWNRQTKSKVSKEQDSSSFTIRLSLPKFILWSIWLKRNKVIFHNQSPSFMRVVRRAMNLGEECGLVLRHKKEEIGNIIPPHPFLSRDKLKHVLQEKQNNLEDFMEGANFFQIYAKRNESVLFFDVASKNNPGPDGSGGLILIPNTKSKISFWESLGVSSNNVAEAKALR
eukprot:Gb_03075 [translate_table: standard]